MRKLLFISLLILSLFLSGCAEQKKVAKPSYPNKPIEMIVPFAAGGATDQIGRIMEKAMKKNLPNGQAIVVVNKPGGASVVGTSEVARAKPDGYKIALVAPGCISVQPHFGNAPYAPADFRAVIRLATSPMLFAVKADAPWQTFNDWVDYVKKNPEQFVYGSGGIGNPPQVAMEQFLLSQNLKVKYVPYEGTSQTYTAMLGGHVDGEITSSQEIMGQLGSNSIKILANFGTSKYDFYKDIPTLKELGYNMSTETYYGIVVPKEVPKEIVEILHDAFKKSMEDPEVIEAFKRSGIKPDYAGPDDFQKQIADQSQYYGKVLKEMGVIK